MRPLLFFSLAGAAGYLVDAALLLLLAPLLGPYGGRLPSFLAAVLTTWLFNRHYTFRTSPRSGHSLVREFSRYLMVCLGGGAVNLLAYSLLVYLFDLPQAWLPLAVAAGSIAGMGVNFTLSRRLVFPPAPRP